MKTIALEPKAWRRLRSRLKKDNPEVPALFKISWVTKHILGFLPRKHRQWHKIHQHWVNLIYLDVYNESAYTMFLMKYSDMIRDVAPGVHRPIESIKLEEEGEEFGYF